jgi:hypothetical protein
VYARGSCVRERRLKGGKRVRERVLRARKLVKRGKRGRKKPLACPKTL